MIHLVNIETDESRTMTIDQFMNWFNDDTSGYLSSVWIIQWVQYEHPAANGQKLSV